MDLSDNTALLERDTLIGCCASDPKKPEINLEKQWNFWAKCLQQTRSIKRGD
jgi:hypothetical protein